MYTKRNNSYGVNTNVSLDPSATATSNQSINNNIVIQPLSAGPSQERFNIKDKNDKTRDVEETPTDNTALIYPSVEAVYNPTTTNTRNEVDKILLDVYTAILLTQNKQLLANILSKNAIIITKSDLERVIAAKINQQCNITTCIPDGCGCMAKATSIEKIESIRIITDSSSLDFKSVWNADYNSLIDDYHISLKYCII